MRVVPALDEFEDGHLRLGLGLKATAVQQLAFQRGEEAFAHGVIETVADRTHGGSYASLLAARSESNGCVLRALVGMMDHVLRPPLVDRHVERIEDELRAQVGRHGPVHDAAAEHVHDHRQKQKAGQGCAHLTVNMTSRSLSINTPYCSTLATSMAHTTALSLTRSAISSHRTSLTF